MPSSSASAGKSKGPSGRGTLWAVPDPTTALLMVRAYELLPFDGKGKPEALREAQIWLRELPTGEALRLVEERLQALKAAGATKTEAEDLRPFSEPHFWAGYQCVGV